MTNRILPLAGLLVWFSCHSTEKAPEQKLISTTPEMKTDSVIVPKKPDRPGVKILPFPKKFSIAKRDVGKFSASIDVGDPVFRKNGLAFWPVMENRFGCYTFDAKEKWEAFFEKSCPDGVVMHTPKAFPEHGGFAFVPFYGDSEYPPAIISVWKTRGDSLDFYAVLDKCFESEGWDTRLSVDSFAKDSSGQNRLSGHLQWTDSEKDKKISRSWSAVWKMPSRLIFD